MKLKLLDIDSFIKKNNILQVKSIRAEGKGGKPDSEGLFSELIFGRIGSSQRRYTFGYIDLRVKIIHPEVWEIFVGICPEFSKIISSKKTYVIGINGELIEDPKGNTGLLFLINNFDKLNLSLLGKNKPENVNFIKKNRKFIFINKILVLPAGVRDIQQSKTTGKKMIQFSEINTFYQEIISQTNTLPSNPEFLPEDLLSSMINAIQRKANEINEWIRQRMKGKEGLMRGGLLRKTVDYSGRLTIVGDPSLQLGFFGIPWQVCLKLFEPFTEYQILKSPFNQHVRDLVRNFIGKETVVDSNDIKRFLSSINEYPDSIPPLLKDELIRIAKEITKDKVVLSKRDPVENRDSWVAAYIRVDVNSFVMKINPLDCPRQGADFDGDQMGIFPLFTKAAIEEAKSKMHPRHTKSMWVSAQNFNKVPYSIELDAASAIYTVTKR